MNKFLNKVLILLFLVALAACNKKDPALPDNLVQFSSDKLGFDSGVSELEVKIHASRAVDAVTLITVTLESDGLNYGTDYTTVPAAVNNEVSLSIPAGSNTAVFKIQKAENIYLNGDESVTFSIASVDQPALTGTVNKLELSFSAITSTGTSLQLEGGTGGASAVNTVFVDLSANRQTSVLRDSWDLGFYSGTDFRVTINSTNGASAIQVNKIDLNTVSSANINPDDLKLGLGLGSFALYDDVSGDITKTVIAEVSATANDNKVYVINRKGGSGTIGAVEDLIKIRVIRKDAGYTLQYAKINETTFKTLDITKDAAYNFQYVSFDKGAVTVEPAKDRWDFQWGWSLYYTGTTPYGFSDLVFTNHHAGVQSAEILSSTVSYADFKESDLSRIVFLTDRHVIGSAWRVTSGGTVGVKSDRFYVIKDAAGNIYKLKFTSFHANDGGERGRPTLEYSLVKKGS